MQANEPRVNLTPGTPKRVSRFTRDILWQRAARGQEIDLVRLANREGAQGLIEGLVEGRSVALTALRALPHAEGAELALPLLCSLDGMVQRQPTEPVLRAIQGISAQLPQPREPLLPGARAACLEGLGALLHSRQLAPDLHDLASSAAELLREHRDAARH